MSVIWISEWTETHVKLKHLSCCYSSFCSSTEIFKGCWLIMINPQLTYHLYDNKPFIVHLVKNNLNWQTLFVFFSQKFNPNCLNNICFNGLPPLFVLFFPPSLFALFLNLQLWGIGICLATYRKFLPAWIETFLTTTHLVVFGPGRCTFEASSECVFPQMSRLQKML